MRWHIDETINLGGRRGSIRAKFIKGQGIALNKCQKSLAIKYRKGGEQIKPSGHRITKSLKNLFQENNVLPWVRDEIPLVYFDEDLINNDYFEKYENFQENNKIIKYKKISD